jgi:hypothetical protein
MPTRRSGAGADDDLAPENYGRLNRAFYAAKPADYLGRRLSNLILTAGRSSDLDALTDEGVTYGSLKVGKHANPNETALDDAPSAEERRIAAEHYVAAEAEVLSHHAGETLLRLYLAHEFGPGGAPPCPWLALSRERTPARFKAMVERRFGLDSDPADPDQLRALAQVFHLTDQPQTLTGAAVPIDLWDQSLANIEGYLRGFARQFLTGAPLYNAAKHGLAVLPGEMSFWVGDGSVVSAEGPTIEVLEQHERDGLPRWSLVRHWVKPDRQMAIIYRAIQLIEALWSIARLRYLLEERPETFSISFFGGSTWLDLMAPSAGSGSGFVLETLSEELLYFEAAPEAS